MSILIKGIKRPKNCDECPLADSYLGCDAQSINCPIIEVPTPHGRLIDADALLRHKGDVYDSEGHLLYAVGTGSIIAAPTIIEAEEGANNENL